LFYGGFFLSLYRTIWCNIKTIRMKENFIKKSIIKHGNEFDYSLVNYINNRTKVKIICPEHGIFEQTPYKHLNEGQKCPKCRRFKKTINEIISDFKSVHGLKFDYSKVIYVNKKTPVIVICKTHGEFTISPKDHLNGNGCSKCAGKGKTTEDVIDEFKIKHGEKYDYSNVKYRKNNIKLEIICKEHGMFYQTYNTHKKGHGCPKCSTIKNSEKKKKSLNEFLIKGNSIHNNKYNYDNVSFNLVKDKVEILCEEHGSFKQTVDSHLRGYGCPLCGDKYTKTISIIWNLLNDNNIKFEINNNRILNKKEIDIFIPSKNIAIEYNGLYWHSDKFKEKNYHLDKTEKCEKLGIRLVHIFEDELVHTPEIVKSKIKNILGITTNKIFGRKTNIKEISNKEAIEFLTKNHLQGYSSSSIRIGLFFNDELVSLMTFCKPKKKNGLIGEYELNRFANKLDTTIIGGASKILNYFIKKYNPNRIISYADRRWSQGNLYKKLGFEIKSINKSDYWYCKSNKRYHKSSFRKDKLIKKLNIEGDFKEWEIVSQLGYVRVWDSGKITYQWNKS
jgi:Zn finger protein HypA/HybF involved in hydrogenase expression